MIARMSRAERLLALLQALRRHRRPVSAADLGRELDVSVRSIYRDIQSLRAQGAAIDGEAGIGFVLQPGFILPPLSLGEDEIDALVLGARWVMQHGDDALSAAARNLIAKVSAVLPEELRDRPAASALMAGPSSSVLTSAVDLADIRRAIRTERKLAIDYRDLKGQSSERIVWPIALGFFDRTMVLAAWCELRSDFRHFRIDHMESATSLDTRYPERRAALLKRWRAAKQIPEQY
jgi:predicted DNA-binding transcriptional regulator YafY